ncbi:hypothetical protein GCM10022254_17700 [Actinomadura meridiana]|uniref:CHRD domain-containing protein n=1 Tax=Actinomadura meridiana TaxID=559626 RepID=A0ABP8BWC8_9ACTN
MLGAAALAAAGMTGTALAAAATAASATTTQSARAESTTTYQAMLDPLNNQSGSGSLTLRLTGDQAVITEHFSGLAATFNGGPFPHVQHIHGGADGVCPTQANDKNGDGVINTAEGQTTYGPIQTTLSVRGDTSPKAGTNLTIAPSGASADYQRTITLDAATLKSVRSGIGVIVVHGDDPTKLPARAQKEKSELVPSLPLAATSPALCGPLKAMAGGGVATGSGSTAAAASDATGGWLLGLGGGLVIAAGAAGALARRTNAHKP